MPIELQKKGKEPKIPLIVDVDSTDGAIEKVELAPSANDLKKLRTLPTSPGDNVSHEVMIQWFSNLTEHQLERIMVQYYRQSPKVILPSGEGYIDCVQGKDWTDLNQSTVSSKHGSGSYSFWVKDEDARKLLFKAKLSLPLDPNNPPKLDPNTLDQSPEGMRLNKGYLNWLQVNGLDPTGKKINQPTTTEPTKEDLTHTLIKDLMNEKRRLGDQTNVIPALITTVQTANQAIIGMVTDQAKSMVDKMTEQRGGNTTDGQAISLLIEQLKEAREQSKRMEDRFYALLMEKKNEPVTPPVQPKTLADQLKELKELKEVVGLFKGGGSSEKEESLVSTLIKELAPALNTGLQLAGQYLMQKTGVVANPVNVSAEGMVNPLMLNNPLIPPAQPATSDVENQQHQIIQQIIGFLEQYHNQISGGIRLMSGDSFADKIEAFNPAMVVQLSKIEPTVLMQIVKNAPNLWNSIKDLGEEKIMTWLTEFHEWSKEQKEEVEEEQELE